MTYVPRACSVCGQPCKSTRCKGCERAYQRSRNAQVYRKAYLDPAYRAISSEGTCWICLMPIDPGAGTRDHVIRLIDGGDNRPENIKPAHRSCNSGRNHHEREGTPSGLYGRRLS